MGGSISKATVEKNAQGIKKMNQDVEKVMQDVLKKYSEIVRTEMGDYHTKLITILREPGLKLPAKPNLNISQVFNKKCSTDLVAIFEKKLNRFPKYAVEQSALFGTSLRPITMELADADSLRKQTLCRNLSSLYVAFLELIEQSVTSLVTCRGEMNGIMLRLTQPFKGPNGNSGPIAESKANLAWFEKMKQLQTEYTKELKNVDKLLKKMRGVTLLSDKQLNKLIADMKKVQTTAQGLPRKCTALVNELKTIKTVDVRQAAECSRLGIAEKNCSANAIDTAIKALEQQQRLASQKLAQRRAELNPVTQAMNEISSNPIGNLALKVPGVKGMVENAVKQQEQVGQGSKKKLLRKSTGDFNQLFQ